MSEFEQLGISGWLQLGSAPTEAPMTTEGPASPTVPSSLPQTGPNLSPDRTSLPEIPKSPTMEQILAELPEKEGNGAHIMLSYDGAPATLTGRYASELVNILSGLEKKYGCGSTLYNHRQKGQIKSLLESGDYFADLILVPIKDAADYANQGLLLPIPTEDLSFDVEGAYYKTACEGLTNDEQSYFLLPSSETPYEKSVVIYCNTALLSRICSYDTDITQKACEGALTLELLCKYLRLAASGLPKGHSLAQSPYSRAELEGFFKKNAIGDDALEMADFVTSAITSSVAKEDAISDFFAGNTVFYIGLTEDLRQFREAADSFAILPLPKSSANEESYPVVYDSSEIYVFAFPKTSANMSSALDLINGLALCARAELRFDFIESLYSSYIREQNSIVFTGVSRFDGKIVYAIPEGSDEEEIQ